MAVQTGQTFDVIVIGGGIKGCAIARDAVGRGLRVLVCEMDDLGSSYIKNIARFGLSEGQSRPYTDRSVLQENAILRRIIPHLSKTTKPSESKLSKWYKLFANQRLTDDNSTVLNGMIDHRLVILNARDAADRGAIIYTNTKFLTGVRVGGAWQVTIRKSGIEETVACQLIVDTADVLVTEETQTFPKPRKITGYVSVALVDDWDSAGSKTLSKDPSDGQYFSTKLDNGQWLIGLKVSGNDTLPASDPQSLLKQEIAKRSKSTVDEVVFQWSGTAQTCHHQTSGNSGSQLEEYDIEIDAPSGALPVFQVRGGSVATARKLAEDVVAEMAPYVKMIGKRWTRTTPLPGGDFQFSIRSKLERQLLEKYNFLPRGILTRLFDDYGTETSRLLQNVTCKSDLGEDFGSGLFETEVQWLLEKEWATSAEDILWRRTRLGLAMSSKQVRRLENWLRKKSACGLPAE